MASPRPPGARKPRRRQQVKLTVGEAKATVLDKLEQFLSRHSASEDLGLRLDGEQLAAGVRFVRIVREGSYDVVVGNPPYQGLAIRKILDHLGIPSEAPRCTSARPPPQAELLGTADLAEVDYADPPSPER